MVNIDGTGGFSGDNMDATIDKVVVWHGTALPVGAANKVPQYGLFLLVDSLSAPTTRTWYIQTSATLSSPNFAEIPTEVPFIPDDTALTKFDFKAGEGASPWTKTNIAGTVTETLLDGIDSGLELRDDNVVNTKGSLSLNNKRHFNPASCIIYGTFQSHTSSGVGSAKIGISNGTNPEADESICIEMYNIVSGFIRLSVWDAGVETAVATNLGYQARYEFKIVCTATQQELFIKVAGVWVSKATQTTKLPTQAAQPIIFVKHHSSGNGNAFIKCSRLVVVNT